MQLRHLGPKKNKRVLCQSSVQTTIKFFEQFGGNSNNRKQLMDDPYSTIIQKQLVFDWSVEINCVPLNNAKNMSKSPSGSISLMRQL